MASTPIGSIVVKVAERESTMDHHRFISYEKRANRRSTPLGPSNVMSGTVYRTPLSVSSG